MQNAEQKTALIAMSGGVDSSIAAYLMRQADFRCMGTTMRLYRNEDLGACNFRTCCSEKDIEDASEVAFQLDIPYEVLDFTLEQNMVLQRFQEPKFQKFGFIKQDAVRSYAEVLIDQYDVRSGQGPITVARSMSGGNQQKIVIAKWLLNDPDIIILDEPTRGIDVGAKRDIYLLLGNLVRQGKAVIMISSEIPELMGICDRIMVMCEGNYSGEVSREEFSQERIMTLASAIKV